MTFRRLSIVLAAITIAFTVFLWPTQASWISDWTGINIDLNREVGTGIGAMASPTIEQFEQSGKRLLKDYNDTLRATADELIKKMDQVAQARISQVDDVMKTALVKIDETTAKRLQENDELTEKRVGNIDTAAAKATYNLDQAASRFVLM